MNSNFNIATLSTKQLVSVYNTLTGKAIKKFSDRATGEKQVAAQMKLFSAPAIKEAMDAAGVGQSEYKVLATKIKNAVAAATKKQPAQPLSEKVVKPTNQVRSAAIASTWKDPEVKAARSTRSHVKVGTTVYRSVKDAFEQLGLPLGSHIKFRMELKQHQQLTFTDAEGKKITFHIAA